MEQQHTCRICVAIGRRSVDEAVAAAREVAEMADVIEIRLDALEQPAVTPFVDQLKVPLLFTCRPRWEGGLFDGPEESRIDLLIDAIRQGVAFVDLELKAPDPSLARLRQALASSETRMIVSSHDFQATADRPALLSVLQAMAERGADIAKIITTAHDWLDVLRVLGLQEDAARLGLPLIAFCMGRAGVISRLATIELGGFMSYCTVNDQEATAPGQIPVRVMREMQQRLFYA
jgi:3-dehydroquinate dehydratase I